MESKPRGKRRFAYAAIIASAALLMVAVFASLQGGPSLTTLVTSTSQSSSTSSTRQSFAESPESYTVNGLTCHFWQGTPSNVTSLVQNLTRDTRFLNATEKGQFMLGNFEKVGPGIQVIGGNRTAAGITIQHPPALELVFYSSLSGPTTCQQLPAEPRVVVFVDVPIQGGLFSMTGADFDCSPAGPWCPSTIHISTITPGGSQGIPIIGYNITLWENGVRIAQVDTCFSYCYFFVTNGQTYQVGAGSNGLGTDGAETFSHWENDGSTGLETVSVPASNNRSYASQLRAVYSPGGATSTTTTTCTVAVPPPQGIYLRVVTDDGMPVSGLPVTSQYEGNASCDRSAAILSSSVAVTNSSGWMLSQAGYPWDFVFSYSGHTYNFTVNSDPMAWTFATIAVPSGILTTHICGLGGGSPNSYCQPAVTTTVRPSG
jgi:hypothetical protein